jgi:hypothetical protein
MLNAIETSYANRDQINLLKEAAIQRSKAYAKEQILNDLMKKVNLV